MPLPQKAVLRALYLSITLELHNVLSQNSQPNVPFLSKAQSLQDGVPNQYFNKYHLLSWNN